jgi:hypothetical protein
VSKSTYSKDDCIEALQKAAKVLGKSPTAPEYQDLDINPTYSVFYYKFGSWNKAKEEAGLEQYPNHRKMSDEPDNIKIDEEWEEISASRRFKLKNHSKISKYKIDIGCERCGYDEHASALDFHHIDSDDKNYNISQKVLDVGFENVKDEIEKCEVICSNCHRKLESDILV